MTVVRGGRPRSEEARVAVLHAVDDLLREVGYAALTMKGIAERAGVGRQTVYRWWSTKAEVLFEAALEDAVKELTLPERATTEEDLAAFVDATGTFLRTSDAGLAYRALLGEAQHDEAVARLLGTVRLFDTPARSVVDRAVERGDVPSGIARDDAVAVVVGPTFYRALAGGPGGSPTGRLLAPALLAALRALPAADQG